MIRPIAAELVAQAGFVLANVEIKLKESPACTRRLTDLPASDVYVRTVGSKRGKHVLTVVIFPKA